MSGVGLNIFFSINDFLKAVLILWGLLGLSFRREKCIRNVCVWFATSGLVLWIVEAERFLGGIVLGFVFTFLLMEGTKGIKLKAFFVANTVIAIIDLFWWSLLSVLFPSLSNIDENLMMDFIIDVLWMVIVFLLFRYRKLVYEYFEELSWNWFLLLLSVLLGLGIMIGSTQYVVYNNPTEELKRGLLIIQSVVVVLVILGCIAFSYHIVTKKNMKLLLEKEEEKYQLITDFYMEKQRQNEEMHRFRHDMDKHMKVIRQFGEDITEGKKQIKQLQEYVNNYLATYPKQMKVHTGHIVSDYFLNELVEEMSGNPQFSHNIAGKFPDKMPVTDVELSILLGNAINNSLEVLRQVQGTCDFLFRIRNSSGNLIINIENTKAEKPIKKEKSDGHGYGIRNMKRIIKRHNGDIEIKESKERFCVEIFL